MSKSLKLDLFFLAFCLLAIKVQTSSYFYSGLLPRYQPVPQESVADPVLETTTVKNGTDAEKLKRRTPYTILHPITFPQSRGGRNLNLTLISESPSIGQVQARILNRPELYPYFTIPHEAHGKDSVVNIPSALQRYSNPKQGSAVKQNIPANAKDKDCNHENLRKEVSGLLSSERPAELNVPDRNFRQAKNARYSAPQRNNKLPNVTPSPKPQTIPNVINSKYKIPPQLYEKVTEGSYYRPPLQQGNIQTWPCFCVPYYLCKNGVINSGGRSVAALKRKTRSFPYRFSNTTKSPPPLVQGKVMNALIIEQVSEAGQCEGNKVCCRLSFADDVQDSPDDTHYPVATPAPDPYYPAPPRYPDDRIESQVCGIRRAYGIQGRLKQLQYATDVSEFGEYPWQVAVLRKVEGLKSLYLCGGVLISSQWVATTAHCIKKEEFSPLLVRLGEWDVNRKDEAYPYVEKPVDAVVLHPEFDSDTLFNDLALIRLRTEVNPLIPHVTPACLPRRGIVYEDQKCWVSGWGKDFFGPQGEYQNVLKEVDVPVVGRALCNEQMRRTNLGSQFSLHPGFLCAGGEAGKDACTGDGGSPLVCRSGQIWYVLGLVSWGLGCGQPGVPGIYVNMLYYIDWIDSIIWR